MGYEANFIDIIITMSEVADTITFLGTAGSRFMVTKQFLASGGAWLNLRGTEVLFDPGPGCLVWAKRRKLAPDRLKAIILSHKHLDHSSDVNIMIEAMTDGGWRRRGTVFAPSDAFNHDPVIFPYLREYVESMDILIEGKSYSIGDVCFETPVRHQHPVETYGFIFHTPEYTFSWITDTRYFDTLPSYYRGDLLIMNVLMMKSGAPIDHLSIPDARQIIGEVKPKVAILTHFGMTIWQAKPWELTERLSQDTGVSVIAARDGMVFDLSQLGKP